MRNLLAITLFLIITSAPAQADPEMDWFIALNVFQAAAQTEIDVIRDHLTPPADANEAAMRKAREDRAAFITQHQELYKLSCAQLKPAKTYQQCSYAGHYAAERDLKAIGRMPAEELRSRIRHLQGVLERQEKLRSGAAGLKKEELKLQWSAVPSKSKAVTNVKYRVDFEAPRVFEVPKPVGVSSATAVYDSGAAKRLPATGPAVGEQQPAGGGGGRLIITRPVE